MSNPTEITIAYNSSPAEMGLKGWENTYNIPASIGAFENDLIDALSQAYPYASITVFGNPNLRHTQIAGDNIRGDDRRDIDDIFDAVFNNPSWLILK